MHPPPPIPCDPRGRRRCVGEAAGPGPAPAGTDAGGHGHGGTQADTGRRRGPQGSTPQAGLPGPPSLPPAEVGWLEAAGDVLPWPAESGTGRWRIKVTAIVSETHQVSGISAGASLALLLKVKIFTLSFSGSLRPPFGPTLPAQHRACRWPPSAWVTAASQFIRTVTQTWRLPSSSAGGGAYPPGVLL